ncbi:MAG: iron-containing alcohol dehydrogenase [Candidatus Bipolaricaulota bacterium]|nr:iron-containing alcohol dehydrogenase [Candidatus Bipolaricaulota bacterium]MBS3791585.1 iron-containing alcohol dehydrogenase [Candidatus Bipolaricaulota bacterium]
MEFLHSLPKSKVLFGDGKLKQLGSEAANYGSNVFLVTGKSSMEKLGFLDKTKKYLNREGLSYTHFNEVTPNPTTETVNKGAQLALGEGCDVVVALGGGSAMDAAKAIAVVAGHKPNGGSEDIWDYISAAQDDSEPITEETLPIITVTSTSGTGSHVTPYAVITNPDTGGKPGFGGPPMFPEVSIVDPEILLEMPPKLTALTGFDVYSHVSENIVSKGDHPTADPYAKEAIKLVSEYLPIAYNNGDDLEAREMMAVADTYAGLSNTIASTGLRHAMEHAVSGHYPEVSHAQGLASLAIPIMEYNIEHGDKKTLERYSKIAKQFGEIDKVTSQKEDALKSVTALNDFLGKLELDKGLRELGVEDSSIESMVEGTFEYMKGDIEHNPVIPDRQDVKEIFKQAM